MLFYCIVFNLQCVAKNSIPPHLQR